MKKTIIILGVAVILAGCSRRPSETGTGGTMSTTESSSEAVTNKARRYGDTNRMNINTNTNTNTNATPGLSTPSSSTTPTTPSGGATPDGSSTR